MIKQKIWDFLAWYKIKPFARRVDYFSYLNRLAEKKEKAEILRSYFGQMRVLSGPFKDLVYPGFTSHGSSLLPKLIGSYEAEIHNEINNLLNNEYTEIIDVGCAEGYYAVGFALKFPNSIVYAFDSNPEANMLCRKMAQANGVEDRLVIQGNCGRDDLLKIPIRKKSLIVSDCEGYELDLFDVDLISRFANSDFLVETHNCFNPSISKILRSRFSSSHTVTSVFSISDEDKLGKYYFHKTARIPGHYLFNLYSEERIGVTEWLICRSKS